MIYDLREVTAQKLCYSAVSAAEACCDCQSTGDGCTADPACCFGCTAFAVGGLRYNTSDACASPQFTNYYHSGTGTYPIVGDIVYSSTTCDSGTHVAQGYYKIMNENTVMEIGTQGLVISKQTC